MPAVTRTRYTLHTLAKGLKVLEALEAADNGLSLTEIAHRLGQSQTVVFRLLRTLAEHGYVQQDAPTKRYTLGLRLWEIGARAAGRTGLVEAARPGLKWLASVTGQTSALVVLRDTDVLYVDVVEGLECLDIPAYSVQYHPEAAAGPHDAAYLFDRFVSLMETRSASVTAAAKETRA